MSTTRPPDRPGPSVGAARRLGALLERNAQLARRQWALVAVYALEPAMYLLALGMGVGALIGDVEGPDGQLIPYAQFVAPAMLAALAMNTALNDGTYRLFLRLRYRRAFDGVITSPVEPGEVAVAEVLTTTIRVALYAAAYLVLLVILGLAGSWWALLAVPASALVGLAFASWCVALTTYMRSPVDFDKPDILGIPLFFFSGTFFPLAVYPGWLELVVRFTPLYQGVALARQLVTGAVDATALGHVTYLVAMSAVGLWLARRRFTRLLTA